MILKNEPHLAQLAKSTKIHKEDFAKNQVIYRANQKASGFYLLSEGIVGLYKNTESGKEHLIRVYGQGDYFGYRSLFSKEPYHLTTKSLTPCSVFHIHLAGIEELYQHAPQVLNVLVKSVCRELGEAEGRLSNIAAFGAKIRIIDSIIELFDRFKQYPWTAREIAEYSGTETQTVIRFCRYLKEQQLLDPNARGICPLDLEGLARLRAELAAG